MTICNDIDRKLPVMLCMNAAILVLFMFLNDSAAFVSMHFYCAALFIIPPALFLGFWSMTACAVITGFLFESGTQAVPGMTPVLFALASVPVFRIREKFRSLDPLGIVSLCWIVNAGLYLASCLLAFPVGMGHFGFYITRIAADFMFSSMVIVLIANFILRVYRSIFYFFGMNLAIPENE